MKINSSSEESILGILQALEMFGLNLSFIKHVIKILRGQNSSFYSLKDFSKKHPEFYNTLDIKAKDKMMKIKKEYLDFYNKNEEEIEFIRLSSGKKQLKNIINVLIDSNALNIKLLLGVISLFESTVVSNGSYQTCSNNKNYFQIKSNNLSHDKTRGVLESFLPYRKEEVYPPYTIIYFNIAMEAKKGSAYLFFDKSNTKIKYILKTKSFYSIEEMIAWISNTSKEWGK